MIPRWPPRSAPGWSPRRAFARSPRPIATRSARRPARSARTRPGATWRSSWRSPCVWSKTDALLPAMLGLQARAAQKNEEFFEQRGFTGVRDFLRRYQRLSGALWLAGALGALEASLWRNAQARHPLPADLARALTGTVL